MTLECNGEISPQKFTAWQEAQSDVNPNNFTCQFNLNGLTFLGFVKLSSVNYCSEGSISIPIGISHPRESEMLVNNREFLSELPIPPKKILVCNKTIGGIFLGNSRYQTYLRFFHFTLQRTNRGKRDHCRTIIDVAMLADKIQADLSTCFEKVSINPISF